MSKTIVNLGEPATVPLSQAVIADGTIYISGQVGRNLATREIAADIVAQTEQCFENLRAVLEAAGASLSDVVKTTVFLKQVADFQAMNDVYGRYFPENPPARSTVRADLMNEALLVEIEAVAVLSPT